MAFPEDRARSHDETLEETPNPAGRSATRNRSPTAPDPSAAALHPSAASFVRAQPPMARTRALEIVRNRSVAFFALDGRGTFRYTARLRPGGGTADASVSKTDIERCVGSNPTPGTTSSPAIARQLIHPTTADVIFTSEFSLMGACCAPMRPAPMPQPHQVGRRWPYGASSVRERRSRASPASGNRKRCGRKRRSPRPEFRQGSESL